MNSAWFAENLEFMPTIFPRIFRLILHFKNFEVSPIEQLWTFMSMNGRTWNSFVPWSPRSPPTCHFFLFFARFFPFFHRFFWNRSTFPSLRILEIVIESADLGFFSTIWVSVVYFVAFFFLRVVRRLVRESTSCWACRLSIILVIISLSSSPLSSSSAGEAKHGRN